MTFSTSKVRRRKKPLWRRVRHKVKSLLRHYWAMVVVIIAGLFTAFCFVPYLTRLFSGRD